MKISASKSLSERAFAARLVCVCSLLIAVSTPAAVPQAINFQAIARRADGTPVASANVRIRATIRQSTASGTIAYQETHLAATSAGGQFALQIGRGTYVSGSSFSLINWPSFPHYLQLEIDPAGGTAYTDMGTQELVSVPYAMNSRKCDAVSGTTGYVAMFDAADSLQSSPLHVLSGFVGINDTTPEHRLDVNGNVRSTGSVVGGDFTAATGNITATAGNLVASAGDVSAPGGKLLAAGNAAVVNVGSGELIMRRATATLAANSISAGSVVTSGDLNFGYTWASTPVFIVGHPYANGANPIGSPSSFLFTVNTADTNSCTINVRNVSNSTASFNVRVDVIAIGTKP
jgi:trimeric autotransporter adhesin